MSLLDLLLLKLGGRLLIGLVAKLRSLKAKLKQWNRDVFGDLNYSTKVICSQIYKLEVVSESGSLFLEEVEKLVWLRKEEATVKKRLE